MSAPLAAALERRVTQPFEGVLEYLVRLRSGDQQPLVDQPRRDPSGAELDRKARLLLDSPEVALPREHVGHVGLIEPHGGALLDKHVLVSDVASPRPVRVEQPWMKRLERSAVARPPGPHP